MTREPEDLSRERFVSCVVFEDETTGRFDVSLRVVHSGRASFGRAAER
jgi:hypothetical protein